MTRPRTWAFAALTAALLVVQAGCAQVGAARCDEPDNSCNRDLSAQALTLRTIRTREPAFPIGSPVNVRSVTVTAFDTYDEDGTGRVGTIYLQEMSPAGDTTDPFRPCPLTADRRHRACALSLFAASVAPVGFNPRPGDIVDIVGGAYDEFDCSGVCGTPAQPFPDGRFIPQVARPTARQSGVAPPLAPIVVTLADIEQHNAALMGVLVTVENVTALGNPDRRGEIQLGAGNNGVRLTQEFTRITGAASGTRWSRITGIVTYFYTPKLVPRSAADLVL